MSNILLGRMRLVGFVKNSRQSLRLALLVKRNDARETKRFFVSQVNRVLFKDCDSKKNRFSGSTSCSQSKNPCEEKTSSERSGIGCESSREKRPEQISSASGTISCDSDQPKSSVDFCQSRSSSSGDSRPRDCKLAANSFPINTPDQKYHLELTPSPFLPPSKEDIKKGRFWRLVTLLGALPVSLIMSFVIKCRTDEESRKPRPEYVPMEYMYRRTKRFPWGDGNHSFFHNPEKNAVPPDGYEVEDPNRVKTND